MSAERRKFTTVQKMDILNKASEMGVTRVLREHKISYSVFSRWKQQMSAEGPGDVLQKEIDLLLEENRRLKRIIGTMALDLEVKQEEIKRIQAQTRARKG